MSTMHTPTEASVDELIAAVKRLPPGELREFERRLSEWRERDGKPSEEEALVRAARVRLPAEDLQRLKRLASRSERGTLKPAELDEYKTLARQAEELDATRLRAAVELGRRWRKPSADVLRELASEDTSGAP